MGISEYLRPLFFWLLVAIIVEWIACKRSREWNAWLTIMAVSVVFFRLYWIFWVSTIRIPDMVETYDIFWIREKTMLTLFLSLSLTGFTPAVVMSLVKVWSTRKRCGRWLSLARTAPVFALAYLFFMTIFHVMGIMSRINTPY